VVLETGADQMRKIKAELTLADMIELRDRIRKYWAANSDLPQYQVAKRFGMNAGKLKILLSSEKPYPARYRQAANRLRAYGIGIDEVAENYEADRRHCRLCMKWDSIENFGTYSAPTIRHLSAFCGGKKNGN
jgi:hypothetical protein